jgi:hypothetical protein
MAVIVEFNGQQFTDLDLALVAITSKGFHDPIGISQVDFIRVLLVLAFLAKLL